MKRRILLFTVLLAISGVCGTAVKSTPYNILDSIRYDIVEQHYHKVETILTNFLNMYPENAEALYLFLASEQTRILDYESYLIDGAKFISTADSIKTILEKRITSLRGKDSIMCLFYLANVHGAISVIQTKKGEWIEGAKNGMSSVSMLKQVKDLYPQYLAPYLGIGVFNYYFNNNLRFLPFSNDRSEAGIAYIEKSLQSEFPFNYAAKNSLCWILIEKKQYKRADSIATSVLNDYPQNSIFLRIKAIAAMRDKRYQNAVCSATELASIAIKRNPVNWSDYVAAYWILVECYNNLGLKNECLAAAETVLDQKIPPEYISNPHIKYNLRNVSEIRQTLSDRQ